MIVHLFRIFICSTSFLYTFYILCSLMYFLSAFNNAEENTIQYDTDENPVQSLLWLLLINSSLLCGFVLQHSVMARDEVKSLYIKFQIDDLQRSIYNISSAAVLHMLLSKWQSIPRIIIWNINTSGSTGLWCLFTFLHVLGWAIIYSGCLMMDISELTGLKQVYYRLSNRPPPLVLKSRELQRYFSHMRHPSFTGFLIILWIYPFMTIDRVLLASVLTVYMALMWDIDKYDYSYHANIIRRKRIELS